MAVREDSTREQIEEAATRWFVRRREGMEPAERDAFETWLSEPEHRRAFEETETLWQTLDALPAGRGRTATANNLSAAKRRRFLYAAASLLLAAGSVTLYRRYAASPRFARDFASRQGELRQASLPDGTVIDLDTDTRLSVAYYADRREVALAHGQAMFTVSPDASRPFRVTGGGVSVTVVGTRFSVRRIGATVAVAVEAGHVLVASDAGERDLFPGDAATVAAKGGTIRTVKVDPAAIGLWRYGRIAFVDAPLQEVLDEFARYGETRLQASPEVRSLRITGSFDVTRTDSFIRTLSRVAPVRYREENGRILILPR